MGRRRKYLNDEERQQANNEKVKQFYWRNKDALDEKAKAYYWRKKIQKLIEAGKESEVEKVIQKAINKGIPKELLVIDDGNNQ